MLLSIGSIQPERLSIGLDIALTYIAFEQECDLVFFCPIHTIKMPDRIKEKIKQLGEFGLTTVYLQHTNALRSTSLCGLHAEHLSSERYQKLCQAHSHTVNI